MSLLKKMIRIAHQNPEMKAKLLPLIKKVASEGGRTVASLYLHVSNSGATFQVKDCGFGPEIHVSSSAMGNLNTNITINTVPDVLLKLSGLFYKAYSEGVFSEPYCEVASIDTEHLGSSSYMTFGWNLNIEGPYDSENNRIYDTDEISSGFQMADNSIESPPLNPLHYKAFLFRKTYNDKFIEAEGTTKYEAYQNLHVKAKAYFEGLLPEIKEN